MIKEKIETYIRQNGQAFTITQPCSTLQNKNTTFFYPYLATSSRLLHLISLHLVDIGFRLKVWKEPHIYILHFSPLASDMCAWTWPHPALMSRHPVMGQRGSILTMLPSSSSSLLSRIQISNLKPHRPSCRCRQNQHSASSNRFGKGALDSMWKKQATSRWLIKMILMQTEQKKKTET